MPTYQLKCKECEHQFTDFHKMSEDHPPCPKCEGVTEVHMTVPPAITLSEARKSMREERKLTNRL